MDRCWLSDVRLVDAQEERQKATARAVGMSLNVNGLLGRRAPTISRRLNFLGLWNPDFDVAGFFYVSAIGEASLQQGQVRRRFFSAPNLGQ